MLEPDLLIDRRRLKRRLALWRVLAVLAVVAALVAVAKPGGSIVGQHVARVDVSGMITEDRKLADAIRKLADDRAVPAVMVSIDSPGGSVAGGESLYAALRQVPASKPVVAVMRGTAASAGYMIAMPAERVFAREATLTGSIGVILQTAEFSGLLKTLGVDAEAITSGPLKDQPSFSRALTPQGRDYLNGIVQDLYDQFVEKVAAGRHMDADAVRKLADGRAYTGRQAKALGLIDEIGGEAEARGWLEAEHHVAKSLPSHDLELRSLAERAFGSALTGLRARLLGGVTDQAMALWTGR